MKPFPLDWDETDKAQAEVEATIEALEAISPETAQRFVSVYEETLETLCRESDKKAAEGRPLPPDEEASLAFSRPTHKTRFQTSQKRSRLSSQGVWYILYWLLDANRDGQPETLRVARVRSASAPSSGRKPSRARSRSLRIDEVIAPAGRRDFGRFSGRGALRGLSC